MAYFKNRIRRKMFLHIFILVLLLACIPTTFIGAGIYVFGTRSVEQVTNAQYEQRYRQMTSSIHEVLSQIEMNVSTGARYAVFDNRIRAIGAEYDPFYIREIYSVLSGIKQSSPYILDAFLYLNSPGWTISDTYGIVDLEEDEIIQTYRDLASSARHTYWQGQVPHYEQTGSHMTFIHKLPVGSTEPAGYIAVMVDAANMEQHVKQMTVDSDHSLTILLDDQGEMVERFGGLDNKTGELRELILTALQEHDSDTFIYRSEGTSYSVSYGTMNRIGAQWILASAVSLEELTAPVRRISQLIIWVSAIGIVLSIALSVLVSYRVYEPIRTLLKLFVRKDDNHGAPDIKNEIEYIASKWESLTLESQKLKEQFTHQLPTMREGFLVQLVQGHFYYLTEEELRNRMEQLGWELQDKMFAFAAVRLLGFSRLSDRYREGDEPLVTFAASNIARELANRQFGQAEVINLQDLTFGILVIHDRIGQEHQSLQEHLQVYAEQLIAALNRMLKLKVMICMDDATEHIGELPGRLSMALDMTHYGDSREDNQIISINEFVQPSQNRTWSYPFHLENDLIEALKNRDRDQAMEILSAFVHMIREQGGNVFHVQQMLLQLLGNLQFTLIKRGSSPLGNTEGLNPFEQLSSIREVDDMLSSFKANVIEPYLQQLNLHDSQQQSRMSRLIQDVIELIHREFASEISLESCADHFQVNLYTLSKAFKLQTGITFIDYLTQVRIEKAKELLRNTEHRINEIAEMVGYQGTYFNRIFKKMEGITPSYYRELHQN
jgi:AraC-like DNA-binding protein